MIGALVKQVTVPAHIVNKALLSRHTVQIVAISQTRSYASPSAEEMYAKSLTKKAVRKGGKQQQGVGLDRLQQKALEEQRVADEAKLYQMRYEKVHKIMGAPKERKFSEEELTRRATAIKKWNRLRNKETEIERQMRYRVQVEKIRAMAELRKISPELFNAVISYDMLNAWDPEPTLPGPPRDTPPMDDYDYQELQKKASIAKSM
eukprot:Clim_evm83s152 gene=Clim_evmTU83s152